MERVVGVLLLAFVALTCLGCVVGGYFVAAGLFVSQVGPELVALITTSVLASGFFAWFLALRGVYSPGGCRSVGLAPVAGLLFLAYLDATWIALDPLKISRVGVAIHRALSPLVTTLQPDLDWILPPLAGLPPALLFALEAIGGLAWKLAAVAPLVVATRGLATTQTGPDEPAFVSYFRGPAIADLQAVCTRLATMAWHGLRGAARGWWRLVAGWRAVLTWPLALPLAIGLIVPAFVGGALLAAIVAIHGGAALVVAGLGTGWGACLGLAERAVVRVRAGAAHCPHAGCNAEVPLPTFHCACGKPHARLLPGRYGALWRRCSCGRTLPTLFATGKGKLAASCPRCHQRMDAPFYAGNVHIPVYGPPGAGKTLWTLTTTWRLLDGAVPGVAASLLQPAARVEWRDVLEPALRAGRAPDITKTLAPDARMLEIRRDGGLPVSLYVYDGAGEALNRGSRLDEHRFLRFVQGVVLAVDATALGPDEAEQLDEQIQRLRNGLAGHGLARFPRRLAVVLTHADDNAVRGALGPARRTPADWHAAGRGQSATIRRWLEERRPRAVRLLESWFPEVRYFAISATGADHGPGRAFDPAHPEAPLCWLLSGRLPLDHPLAVRAAWAGAEACVLAVMTAPLWGGALAILLGASAFIATRLLW